MNGEQIRLCNDRIANAFDSFFLLVMKFTSFFYLKCCLVGQFSFTVFRFSINHSETYKQCQINNPYCNLEHLFEQKCEIHINQTNNKIKKGEDVLHCILDVNPNPAMYAVHSLELCSNECSKSFYSLIFHLILARELLFSYSDG